MYGIYKAIWHLHVWDLQGDLHVWDLQRDLHVWDLQGEPL